MNRLVALLSLLCVTHVYVGLMSWLWNSWEGFHTNFKLLVWLINTGYILYILIPLLSVTYALIALTLLGECLKTTVTQTFRKKVDENFLNTLDKFPSQAG